MSGSTMSNRPHAAAEGLSAPPAGGAFGDVLTISDLHKGFGSNAVLTGVNLQIREGEIRALLGLNGSGKSTLIRILSGFHPADRGHVSVAGSPLDVSGHRRTAHPGMRFVHQDLGLAANLSAADNMALASTYPRTKLGTIDWRRARDQARRSLEALGYDFDPARTIGQLRPVERAGTAIARAISDADNPVKLLVLDEPTAALPAHECERLFDAVRRLAHNGTAVLYVTHHLDEVFELAHRVSLLRNGRIVDDALVQDRTHDALIEAMSGRPFARERAHHDHAADGPASLRITGLRTKRLRGIDLRVAAGEIVGVAGITGSGRDELAPALMGVTPREGEVRISDALVPPLRPHRAVAAGMACVPANRLEDALLPAMTVKQNITIAGLRSLAGRRFVRSRLETRAASALAGRLSVRPAAPGMPVVALSGGNQQKIVLGRWLGLERTVFVLDEPTQGVDVEARATVYRELREISIRSAVLVCSSDSDELAEICDRILVICNGRVAAELHAPVSAADIDAIALGSGTKDGGQ